MMNIKIELTDKTVLDIDTIRENFYSHDNGEGRTQLTMIIDSKENLGDIDSFRTMFTETNLATIKATTSEGIITIFKGYTKIVNLTFSPTQSVYHYEFNLKKA